MTMFTPAIVGFVPFVHELSPIGSPLHQMPESANSFKEAIKRLPRLDFSRARTSLDIKNPELLSCYLSATLLVLYHSPAISSSSHRHSIHRTQAAVGR